MFISRTSINPQTIAAWFALKNTIAIEKFEKLSLWVRIIPAWVPANLITAIRGLLLIPIYFTYQMNAIAWTIALFFLASFTDVVDGLHARYRKQESWLGKILDPAFDKVLILGLLFLIAPGRLSPYIIYVIVGLELALVFLVIVIKPISMLLRVKRKLGANVFGKIKMVLEGAALLVLLAGLNSSIARQVAEDILWCAALFAVLSIILHLTSNEKTH